MKGRRFGSGLAGVLVIAGTVSASAADEGVRLNVLRPKIETVAPSQAGLQKAPAGPVDIVFVFVAPLNPASTALYNAAASVWENRIPTYGAAVNGPAAITITVSEPAIDGPGGILGSAGPTFVTTTDGFTLTTQGTMQFDSADVANMIAGGTYAAVIEHEMGHVLGIGTLWTYNSVYVDGSGTYTGANALAAWKANFSGQAAATSVPVELGGGSGTANGHWNEGDGGTDTGITEISSGIDMKFELMTGWLNAPARYTALTHRSMADLGYTPNATLPVELTSFSVD